jgi:hypothetical protein
MPLDTESLSTGDITSRPSAGPDRAEHTFIGIDVQQNIGQCASLVRNREQRVTKAGSLPFNARFAIPRRGAGRTRHCGCRSSAKPNPEMRAEPAIVRSDANRMRTDDV